MFFISGFIDWLTVADGVLLEEVGHVDVGDALFFLHEAVAVGHLPAARTS